MAHRTFKARYYSKLGMTEAEHIRENIRLLQKKQLEREELLAHASAAGWQESASGSWRLYQAIKLKAEVFKTPDCFSFTAVVWHWHDGSHAEHDSRALPINAMRWCEDRIRAARINARAAELERTGAEDASEGSMWDAQRASEDRAI